MFRFQFRDFVWRKRQCSSPFVPPEAHARHLGCTWPTLHKRWCFCHGPIVALRSSNVTGPVGWGVDCRTTGKSSCLEWARLRQRSVSRKNLRPLINDFWLSDCHPVPINPNLRYQNKAKLWVVPIRSQTIPRNESPGEVWPLQWTSFRVFSAHTRWRQDWQSWPQSPNASNGENGANNIGMLGNHMAAPHGTWTRTKRQECIESDVNPFKVVSFCWEKSGVVAKDPIGAPGPLENLWTSVIRDSNIFWAYSQASSNTFWQAEIIPLHIFSGMSTNHFPKGNHAWPVTSCDFEWSLKLEYSKDLRLLAVAMSVLDLERVWNRVWNETAHPRTYVVTSSESNLQDVPDTWYVVTSSSCKLQGVPDMWYIGTASSSNMQDDPATLPHLVPSIICQMFMIRYKRFFK